MIPLSDQLNWARSQMIQQKSRTPRPWERKDCEHAIATWEAIIYGLERQKSLAEISEEMKKAYAQNNRPNS